MSFLSRLKGFDAHARPQAHLTRKTTAGAVVTLCGLGLMAILFLHELAGYLLPERVVTMGVDSTRNELLRIDVDMSFPGLPCHVLSLDALDASGKHEADVRGALHKERVAANGTSLGVFESHVEDDMLGFIRFVRAAAQRGGRLLPDDSPRIKKVEAISAALRAREGCRVFGHLAAQRVAGNFHVSVHGQDWETLQMVYDKVAHINVSHVIKRLSFGEDYPGKVDPLNGFVRVVEKGENSGTYKYFLKIVPARYARDRAALRALSAMNKRESSDANANANGGRSGVGSRGGPDLGGGGTLGRTRAKLRSAGVVETNLYSVTEYFKAAEGWSEGGLPAVFFIYDLSPIVMEVSDAPKSLGHFLARCLAVVGGVFAVTGMTDRWIHRAAELMSKNA